MFNILLVEQPQLQRSNIHSCLIKAGNSVVLADGPEKVDIALSHRQYQLVIFDISCGGLKLLKTVIAGKLQAKLLLVSTRERFAECLQGLNLGADDYIDKPVNPDSLMVQVKDLCLRPESNVPGIIQLGDLQLNTSSKQVRLGSKQVKLTPSEYRILELLLKNQSEVLSHQRINVLARGKDSNAPKNSTEAHICSLRRKLFRLGLTDLIRTHRGFGYIIEPQSVANSAH